MAKIKKWKPDGVNTAYPVTSSKAVVYAKESDATTTVLIDDKIDEMDVFTKTYSGVARKNLAPGLTFSCTATGHNATSLGGDANGDGAFSIGDSTKANGNYSFAEGANTIAYGDSSHAEGSNTTTRAFAAHAEGYFTEAKGDFSHAEGHYTKTNNENEHAEGIFNLSTTSVTLHSIGIGTTEATRKNAEETTVDGKRYVLGIGGYDGTNVTTIGVEDVATVVSNITTQVEDIEQGICGDYDASKTYKVGALVRKDKLLYICNTDIDTAEAWDVMKWTRVASNHSLIPTVDGVTLQKNASGVIGVKDDSITLSKLEPDLQKLLILLSNFIEVKETGYYVTDANLNTGFGVENPECYGLGLKNE